MNNKELKLRGIPMADELADTMVVQAIICAWTHLYNKAFT